MAFVNLSLLVGGVLIGLPIALHLLMRQRPRQLEFPALRFLISRQATNQRSLRLRHWLLLLLRCLALAILAIALARPSVSSATLSNWMVIGILCVALVVVLGVLTAFVLKRRSRGIIGGLAVVAVLLTAGVAFSAYQASGRGSGALLGDQQAPVAAAIIFDTSPRMQYKHENQTRLERAQSIARGLLTKLPEQSQLAILHSQSPAAVFSVDRGAATEAVDHLTTAVARQSLEELLRDAIDLLESSQLARRELYLITDLTKAAWPESYEEKTRQTLEAASDVAIYVLDVGAREPRNFFLGDPQLSQQTIGPGGSLTIKVPISCQGPGAQRDVELHVEQFDPQLPIIKDGKPLLPTTLLRDRQPVTLEADGLTQLSFKKVSQGLTPGIHHAQLRIIGEDGLAVDNVRYFTFEVHDAWPVLIAAPQGVDTRFVEACLEEDRFACKTASLSQVPWHNLPPYAAIFLLDPPSLADDQWRALTRYVRDGGRLAILLGHNASPVDNFNSEAAAELMPGALAGVWRSGQDPVLLAPPTLGHVMLREFRASATSVPWNQTPIRKHWRFDSLNKDSAVVVPFTNSRPAIIERHVGTGLVLTMTTPYSDTLGETQRRAWNQFQNGEWPPWALLIGMGDYLVGANATVRNYSAGDRATLGEREPLDPSAYYLFTPEGGSPQQVTPLDGVLTIRFTDKPGTYRLKPTSGGMPQGFSVNLPASASRLARRAEQHLDTLLGENRYQLARSQEAIEREIGIARIGREFFPTLMLVVALVLGMEHTLANRFYKKH